MSTHNIGFYEDLTKIIFELSSNINKYAPYFFCWLYLANVSFMLNQVTHIYLIQICNLWCTETYRQPDKCSWWHIQPRAREFAGLIPGFGTFFHQLSVTGERMSTECWLVALVIPALKRLDRITDCLDMTSSVHCERISINKQKKQQHTCMYNENFIQRHNENKGEQMHCIL